MNTMKKLWVAAACTAAFALASCQQETFEGRLDSGNYYASVETFGTDTRTALGERRSVVWSSEDRIAIFEGNGTGQAYKILDSYVGKSSGEFAEVEGLMTEGTDDVIEGTIAVYPFNEELTIGLDWDTGEIAIVDINFPSEQKYVAGSFSDEAFPMVAVSPEGSRNLSFKNIGGVLKLSLTGSYSVSKITLTGNSGESLSGPATVTIGSDGIPSVTMSYEASRSVSLVCSPAVQLDPETATDFYISIPPTEFEGGFCVTVTDSESHQTIKTTDKHNTAERSSVLAMPELYENDFEEAETEQWVDLGLSVLWAAWNVDATSPEEYGGYYAWGETSTKSNYTFENYKFYNPSTNAYDFIGNEISGTSYDVAHVKWGGGARMPTFSEVDELVDNCTFTGGYYKGVRGNFVTGSNGNSIFLPFAGSWEGSNLSNVGFHGFFWSGTDDDVNSGLYAYALHCFEGVGGWEWDAYRYPGYSVRPVKNK